jgi:hypothetical protein
MALMDLSYKQAHRVFMRNTLGSRIVSSPRSKKGMTSECTMFLKNHSSERSFETGSCNIA